MRSGVTFSTRFARISEYLRDVLPAATEVNSETLGNARRALLEGPPLSHHLGVIRIGFGRQTLVDLLMDTTGADIEVSATAAVVFWEEVFDWARNLSCVPIPADAAPDVRRVAKMREWFANLIEAF